jgi:hypothetical protein
VCVIITTAIVTSLQKHVKINCARQIITLTVDRHDSCLEAELQMDKASIITDVDS